MADTPVNVRQSPALFRAAYPEFSVYKQSRGVTLRDLANKIWAGWANRVDNAILALQEVAFQMGAPTPEVLIHYTADFSSGTPFNVGSGDMLKRLVVMHLTMSTSLTGTTKDTITPQAVPSGGGSARNLAVWYVAQSVLFNTQPFVGVIRLDPGETFRITSSQASNWRANILYGYVDA